MEVDPDCPENNIDLPILVEKTEKMTVLNEIEQIIKHLTKNESIVFKNQQRGEKDPTVKEKTEIAEKIYEKSKVNFLLKFGKYLKIEHLKHFKQFTEDCYSEAYEVRIILKDIARDVSSNIHHVNIRNRRYEALKQMIKEDNSYFSEIEMMKRNPLLYEQLVGQYLTEDEKKERDQFGKGEEQVTFVKILMEGIERDNAELYKKRQEEKEDDQMEEEDSSSEEEDGGNKKPIPKPSTSRWGEFEEGETTRLKHKRRVVRGITARERALLRDEFTTTMYESFLDGRDEDFDYGAVDNDIAYDNVNEMEHDAEDRYFDGEDADGEIAENNGRAGGEDELDVYMNALNQHPAVRQLAGDAAPS